MKTIVAVDNNWGIGKKNDLLFHLKKDMQYFREKTLNKVVVMGSNTLFSFPGSKPLPKRINIVLYPGGKPIDGCIVVQSLEELSAKLKEYNSDDIFIVGGAMFYRTMLDYCDTAYITKVEADGEAEVFFENLDLRAGWELVDEGAADADEGYNIKFSVYKNKLVKTF
ncbi:MAG: dihydrofolate reductase [Clostridia bacterium]|nr:dihydrofolate reductase [Clostridia bacterium]